MGQDVESLVFVESLGQATHKTARWARGAWIAVGVYAICVCGLAIAVLQGVVPKELGLMVPWLVVAGSVPVALALFLTLTSTGSALVGTAAQARVAFNGSTKSLEMMAALGVVLVVLYLARNVLAAAFVFDGHPMDMMEFIVGSGLIAALMGTLVLGLIKGRISTVPAGRNAQETAAQVQAMQAETATRQHRASAISVAVAACALLAVYMVWYR